MRAFAEKPKPAPIRSLPAGDAGVPILAAAPSGQPRFGHDFSQIRVRSDEQANAFSPPGPAEVTAFQQRLSDPMVQRSLLDGLGETLLTPLHWLTDAAADIGFIGLPFDLTDMLDPDSRYAWDKVLPGSGLGKIKHVSGKERSGKKERKEPGLGGSYPEKPEPVDAESAALSERRQQMIDHARQQLDRIEIPTASGEMPIYKGGYAFRSQSHKQARNEEHREFLKSAELETIWEGTPDARTKMLWKQFKKRIIAQEGDTAAINTWDRQIVTIGAGFSARAGAAGSVLNRMPGDYRRRLFECGIRVNADNSFTVLDLDRGAVERGTNALHLLSANQKMLALLIELAQSEEPITQEDDGREMEMRQWMLAAQFEEFVRRNAKMPASVLKWPEGSRNFAIKLRHWAGSLSWGKMGATGGDVPKLAEYALEKVRSIQPTSSEELIRGKIRSIAARSGVESQLPASF